MTRTEQQNEKIKDALSSIKDEADQIDQISKIRGWFRPRDDSPSYGTIQEYLNGYIDRDETTSRLFGPIDEKIAASKLDDVNFTDLWYGFIHSSKRMSFGGLSKAQKNDTIVDLVALFKEHSIPEHEKYNYLYSAMTDFDIACREAYNDAPVAHNGFFDAEIDAWANMNLFYALVAERGLHDLSLYAIFALRQALESPPQDDDVSTASQKYDAYVPAAAAWISGFGHDLFRKEKDLTPTDRKQGNPARGGELYKGVAGFNKERWALWKDRFVEIGEMEDVQGRTRVAAKDAVQGMKRSETYEFMR